MERVLFFALCMVCHLLLMAQDINEHLTFKGVPIDGTLNEYVSKMKDAGFSYVIEQDGIAILRGDFAGFKGCSIGVATLKDVDIVNTINVVFPAKEDWSLLESDYLQLKELLTQKYGEPFECIEEFYGTYNQPVDNKDKIYRLESDRCTYYTLFKTSKGNIRLSLGHQGLSSCFVQLQYFDKVNTESVRAKALEDL